MLASPHRTRAAAESDRSGGAGPAAFEESGGVSVGGTLTPSPPARVEEEEGVAARAGRKGRPRPYATIVRASFSEE